MKSKIMISLVVLLTAVGGLAYANSAKESCCASNSKSCGTTACRSCEVCECKTCECRNSTCDVK